MEGDMETVVCELKYSGVVPGLIAGAALATLAIAMALPWSLLLRASIGLGVCGLALRSAREILDVRSVRVEADSTVTVTARTGLATHGRLRGGSFVAPWLTIVRWRPDGARFDRTVLVLAATADAAHFRRLRIRLRSA
jgi:hypothetical protein